MREKVRKSVGVCGRRVRGGECVYGGSQVYRFEVEEV